MSLDKYRIDKAFTAGVELQLDGEPEKFKVRLPSRYHRAFTNHVYAQVQWKVDDQGSIIADGGISTLSNRQQEAFAEHCILSIDGEPVPENFLDEYPGAVEELWHKACDMAEDIDATIALTAKKSLASLSGEESGEESDTSSTGD